MPTTAASICLRGARFASWAACKTALTRIRTATKRYATDIVAEDVEFISPKNTDGGSYSGSGAGAQKVSAPAKKVSELEPVDTDDLPF